MSIWEGCLERFVDFDIQENDSEGLPYTKHQILIDLGPQGVQANTLPPEQARNGDTIAKVQLSQIATLQART